MRVIVVGGGIGGLALAAGLRRHDLEVGVFDRDIDVADTGGYHITLDGRAQTAMRDLLEPNLYQRLLASSSAVRSREPDAFWDRRGRLLGNGPDLSADPSIDIDRISLRQLLAEATGESLALGRCVTQVGYKDDGSPRAVFADGSVTDGDLLVGADGTHSLVARFLAGRSTNSPVGIIGYSGRTLVSELTPEEQQRLGPRSGLAIGPYGAALYVGFLDPVGRPALDAPELRKSVTTAPTYIWGAMFAESPHTESMRGMTGVGLREALLTQFRRQRWTEKSLEVVARTDPDSVAAFRFDAAPPQIDLLAPWQAGTITALGDAVHATPPTAGMGAGAAVRDAASLVDRILAVQTGASGPTAAVGDFEAGMRLRGSEVLTHSLKTVRWILATNTRLGAAATGAVIPVMALTNQLKRAVRTSPSRIN